LKEVQNRVIREIFLAPSVVLPIVAGASAWLLSWAGNGIDALTLAGLVGVLGGFGWMATRAIFQTESLTHQTIAKMKLQALQAEQAELDRLDQLLSQDKDDRDQDLLRLLRAHRAQFEEFASQPEIAIRSQGILNSAKQLFAASVNNLSESYKLLEQSRKLSAKEQRTLLGRREQLLAEIRDSVDHLESTLTQYKKLTEKSTGGELTRLRDDLDANLLIAKRTEERIRALEGFHTSEPNVRE
jgi:hypothetical protein